MKNTMPKSIALFVLIIGFYFAWFVLHIIFYNSPKFIILNYTNSPCYYYLENSTNKIKLFGFTNEELKNITLLTSNQNPEKWYIWDYKKNNQVFECQIEEVDEIKISWECSDELKDDGYICVDGRIPFPSISQQNLTFNWLNAKAECVSCWSKKSSISSEEGQCNGRYPEKFEVCSKWKLDNYIVEVIK